MGHMNKLYDLMDNIVNNFKTQSFKYILAKDIHIIYSGWKLIKLTFIYQFIFNQIYIWEESLTR